MDVYFVTNRKGFSLLEFVFVIAIVGTLSVGAYLAWQGTNVNLGSQAIQLADDIRYTQALSMSKGQRYRLVRLSATSYNITNSSGTAIMLPLGSTTVTFGPGISFGTWTNLPNNLIAFNTKGVPYVDTGSPGTALASTATIALVAGSKTQTISISPTTGRIIVQ